MQSLPADQMVKQAFTALSEGRAQFAEQCARSVVRTVPGSVDGWVVLGRALNALARFDDAEEALTTADRLLPNHPETLLARGQLCWRLGRDTEVLALGERALKLRPDNIEAIILIGSAQRRLRRTSEAIKTLSRAKDDPAASIYLGQSHLDRDDPRSTIHAVLAHSRSERLPPTTRCALFHVLGQAQERLGRYDEAFRSYAASKSSVKVNFGEDLLKSGLVLMREVFTRDRMHHAPKPTVRTSRPVFIASMPRSGTTLLDRIIASHPMGGGAGETRALRGQIAEWMKPDPATSWPRIAATLGAADFDRIASRYLAETNVFGPRAERIADKHLQNWVYVGLIAMAFPDARVIHLRRDPMDVGISCFERLEPTALPWSASLKHIGMTIRATEELMEYWKANAPIPILTVQYEDLVRETETEARRILDFLGLPWDAACLAHHTAGRGTTGAMPAPTLASEQAARPMSDASIGRAARFGALLDPLREALAAPL